MNYRNTRASSLAVALSALLLASGAFLFACDTYEPTPEESAEATRILLSPKFWDDATGPDVQELIERGGDPEAKYDSYGSLRDYTPLHMAASSGNAEAVKALLKAGADPNVKSYNGSTPLLSAVINGRSEAVKVLIEAGANPKARHNGTTLRDWANRAGHTHIADILRRAGPPTTQESEEATYALLDESFWAYATDSNVRELLDMGADLKAKDDRYGATPLHWAAAMGRAKMVKLLLKAGADPKAKNNNGDTPLHQATGATGNVETVKVLLKAGADPKAKDNRYGATPLHGAAFRGNAKMVKLLLKAGANPKAKVESGEHRGRTPRDFAKTRGHTEIAEILQRAGG